MVKLNAKWFWFVVLYIKLTPHINNRVNLVAGSAQSFAWRICVFCYPYLPAELTNTHDSAQITTATWTENDPVQRDPVYYCFMMECMCVHFEEMFGGIWSRSKESLLRQWYQVSDVKNLTKIKIITFLIWFIAILRYKFECRGGLLTHFRVTHMADYWLLLNGAYPCH